MKIKVIQLACGLALLALTASVSAQNLYVGNNGNDSIFEITPTGTITTFASGMGAITALAFDSGGNLFAASAASMSICRARGRGLAARLARGRWFARGVWFAWDGWLVLGLEAEG